MNKNRIFKEKGITLIALVVTIVVLLILAGVSIAVLTGENGIINRTTEAKKTTEESEVIENIRLAFNNAQIGRYAGEHSTTDYATFASTMQTDLLKTYIGATVTSNGDGTYVATINGKPYDVDANGNVTKQGASIVVGEATFKDASGNDITTKIQQGEGTVYIHFTASLAGGTITGVTSTGLSPTLTNGEWVTAVTANGTYEFNITGSLEDGQKTATKSVVVKKFSNGLQIGSVVSYTPAGATYTWSGEYATTGSTDTDLDSRTGGNAVITSWKVLDIDETTEMVKLVPASQPSPTVTLQGANGYNNAVYLLNEACKTLYTNTSLGITTDKVRNINIEDIEGAMKTEAITTAKNQYNHNNTSSYGHLNTSDQVSTAYSKSYSYYPLIYAQETKSVINTRSGLGTLNESQQTNLIGRTDKINELQSNGTDTIEQTATQGKVQATTSIQPYQTYYYMSLTASGNEAETGQSAVLCPSNNDYWVASRCVYAFSNACSFSVRIVSGSGLNASYLFDSNNGPAPGPRSLFHVVSLSSELITKNGNNFQVGTQN